jgi:8-oxo-dGTP pyrophosphatase MutT (NUDIX family)
VRSTERSCSKSASSASTWPPERLARVLPKGNALQAPSEHVEAAVLVPLFIDPATLATHVVLTRRRADLRRHAGEIAFPGGRQDPDDAHLRDTALREAEEEIGLQPSRVSVIGELAPVSTIATGYLIHPFVAVIPPGQAWRLSPLEVDGILELTLDALRGGRTRTVLQRRGFTFETDAYVVDEHLIWGATARIVEQLLGRLLQERPGAPLRLLA